MFAFVVRGWVLVCGEYITQVAWVAVDNARGLLSCPSPPLPLRSSQVGFVLERAFGPRRESAPPMKSPRRSTASASTGTGGT
jgi:hypothetical protein